jgi:hypothetical protein
MLVRHDAAWVSGLAGAGPILLVDVQLRPLDAALLVELGARPKERLQTNFAEQPASMHGSPESPHSSVYFFSMAAHVSRNRSLASGASVVASACLVSRPSAA